MEQPEIPRKKWVIEFFILLGISFAFGSAIFFFSDPENLVLRYIVLSLAVTVAMIGTYFRTYRIIFFLEAKIKEKHIERKQLKGIGKKLGIRFIIYGIIFMVFMLFDESSRRYWYIIIICGGLLGTLINYPDYRLKYNKELVEGKLDEEEQKYMDSEAYKWFQYLPMYLPVIILYLFF